MYKRVRAWLKPSLTTMRRSPGWIAREENYTLREKVAAICLMIYYLHPVEDVKRQTEGIFQLLAHRVKKKKFDGLQDYIYDDSQWESLTIEERTICALRKEFIDSAETALEQIESDSEIDLIAHNLFEEYFV